MTRTVKIGILTAILFLCAVAAMMQGLGSRGRQASPPAELYQVVQEQIRAFRADDFASAYRQASAGFQERFNIEAFSDLARAEYPGLMRPGRIEFGAVRMDGRRALVPAYFFLPDGDVIPCIYSLVLEDEAWKIDSARILKRWPSSRRLGGLRS